MIPGNLCKQLLHNCCVPEKLPDRPMTGKTPFFGLDQGRWGKHEKRQFWGSKTPIKPVENLLFYPNHFSVGDYLPGKGAQPQNITNS